MAEPAPEPLSNTRRLWLLSLVLAAVTLALYWPVRHHDFVSYDDPDYVTRHPLIQRGLTAEGLAWAFGRLHGATTYWHPLTWVSHMLDCQWFGLNPGPPHLENALWHALNAVLLFWALRRLTGRLWPSAVVAALFAWHPVQVDTVAWVAERKNLLSGCFWMLTLLAWARYVERPGPVRYALVLLPFVLGLMSKPVLVTLPCVLLLLDLWPLRRLRLPAVGPTVSESPSETVPVPAVSETPAPGAARRSPAWLVWEKLPLFALALASGIVTLLAHRAIGMARFETGLPLGARLENALVSYARYLGKLFWPSKLTVLHLHPGDWPAGAVNGAILLLAAISLLAFWQRRRAPFLAVGWLWFVGVLAPFIGLVQVGAQAMAERFVYLPLIGVGLMVVWGLAALTEGWAAGVRHKFLAVLGGGALAGCVMASSFQLRHWQNSITLFQHAVAVDPNNYIAHNNLAHDLGMAGQWEQALAHAHAALRIKPDFAKSHTLAGMILDELGQPAEALPHFQAAAQRAPHWALARLNLARALAALGQTAEAIEHYTAALSLEPADALAHAALADLLTVRGQTAEAIAHYRAALAAQPDTPEVLNNLAWLLATAPSAALRDGAQAVRLAERACGLTRGEVPLFLGTLAAAYAEAGRFPDAVRTARRARELALAAGQTNLALRNEQLLKSYEAGQPHREGR